MSDGQNKFITYRLHLHLPHSLYSKIQAEDYVRQGQGALSFLGFIPINAIMF
jgi:hypothetical protein